MTATTSNRAQWTADEIATLIRLYPTTPAHDIAARLGRPRASVYKKAWLMGLKKDAECLASQHSARMRQVTQSPASVASRFKPGQKPWNKGLSVHTGGRSVETQFRPGRRPEQVHNYQPIGSLRISKDGILERKVTDDPSLVPARRWTSVARLVWEAAHGPIPPGHNVVFKPGLRTTVEAEITIDRLECISRTENARRNSLWNRPTELARLYQLKGAITRQVNRINREHREQHQSPGEAQ